MLRKRERIFFGLTIPEFDSLTRKCQPAPQLTGYFKDLQLSLSLSLSLSFSVFWVVG